MKLTRKQLKKIILKEFDMSGMMDNDIDNLLGAGGQPPTKPPEYGRGGGGRGPRKNPCESGMPRFEASYDLVFETFAVWVQNNERFGGPNGKDNFENYFDYLISLGLADDDEGIFDVIKGMMDVFATYYCATRSAEFPPTIETVYNNPQAAVDYYTSRQ